MAGASGKKLDETYKLAWIRGLKTTYYLRAMGATHAEKSTVKASQLNAVPTEGAEEPKSCSVETPDCEACQCSRSPAAHCPGPSSCRCDRPHPPPAWSRACCPAC